MTREQKLELWMLHMNELQIKPWDQYLPIEFARISQEAGRRMKLDLQEANETNR